MEALMKIVVFAILVLIAVVVLIAFFTQGIDNSSSVFDGIFDWFKNVFSSGVGS